MELDLPITDDLVDRIVAAAANQVLHSRVAGDGESPDGYQVDTEVARRLQQIIREEIQTAAAVHVPALVRQVLETGEIPGSTDRWGDPTGKPVSIKKFIGEEIIRQFQGRNRSGANALMEEVRKEITAQLQTDLKDQLEQLRRSLAEAVTRDMQEAVVAAARKAVPGIAIEVKPTAPVPPPSPIVESDFVPPPAPGGEHDRDIPF